MIIANKESDEQISKITILSVISFPTILIPLGNIPNTKFIIIL